MLRRIKRELTFLIDNAAVLGLGAFLCCAGGILLWVNGGGGWIFLHRSGGREGMTAAFLLWLLAYGLMGAALAMIVLAERARLLCGNRAVIAFALLSSSYLLSLIWYALFFCTHLHHFAGMLLTMAAILTMVNIVVTKRTFWALQLFLLMTFGIELLFLLGEIIDSL